MARSCDHTSPFFHLSQGRLQRHSLSVTLRFLPLERTEANDFFLDQTRRFFQHDDGNDSGMFSLLELLKNSACAFSQHLLSVGSSENQRMSVTKVNYLSRETTPSRDFSLSFLISLSALLMSPISVILPRNLNRDSFTVSPVMRQFPLHSAVPFRAYQYGFDL